MLIPTEVPVAASSVPPGTDKAWELCGRAGNSIKANITPSAQQLMTPVNLNQLILLARWTKLPCIFNTATSYFLISRLVKS